MKEAINGSIYEAAPLAGAALIMTASGSLYMVSAYSGNLQILLGLSSGEVTAFSTCVAAGTWLALVPMASVDRYGPKGPALVGVAMTLLGYGAVAAAAAGVVHVSGGELLFFGFLVGHGAAWTQAAAVVTVTVNTPVAQRGAAIGLLSANFSLSSGYYTQLLEVFDLGTPAFLAACGVGMAGCVLIALPATHMFDGPSSSGDGGGSNSLLLWPLAWLTALNAALVACASLIGTDVAHVAVLCGYGVLMLVCASASALMAATYGRTRTSQSASFPRDPAADARARARMLRCCPCAGEARRGHGTAAAAVAAVMAAEAAAEPLETTALFPAPKERDGWELAAAKAASGPSFSSASAPSGPSGRHGADTRSHAALACGALGCPAFWLVFLCFGVGVGSGLSVLDSVSPLVDSLATPGLDEEGADPQGSLSSLGAVKANLVALFAAANTAGRIGAGALSDRTRLLAALDPPSSSSRRPVLLALHALAMAAGLLVTAFAGLRTLPFGLALCGLAYGGFWVLVPAIVADLYGTAAYGFILGAMLVAPTLGTAFLYDGLTGTLYARAVAATEAQGDDGSGSGGDSVTLECVGDSACFRPALVVMAALCVVGAASSALVTRFRALSPGA